MQKKELSGGKPAVMREILDECLGDLARPRDRCESSMNFQPAGKVYLWLRQARTGSPPPATWQSTPLGNICVADANSLLRGHADPSRCRDNRTIC